MKNSFKITTGNYWASTTFKKIVLFFCLTGSLSVHAQTGLVSHFSTTKVLEQILEEFDLASIRSSFGPRRDAQHRTFKSFQLKTRMLDANTMILEDDSFSYRLQLLSRRDINRDGVEDLEICFSEKAKMGSYDTQKPILVTKYAATGFAIALEYEVDGCEKFTR